jgi:hypothetical protein
MAPDLAILRGANSPSIAMAAMRRLHLLCRGRVGAPYPALIYASAARSIAIFGRLGSGVVDGSWHSLDTWAMFVAPTTIRGLVSRAMQRK